MPAIPHSSTPLAGAHTTEELVTTLYQAVLGREPDPGGFAACCEGLRSGNVRLDQLAASFFNSDEHRLTMTGPSGLRDVTQYGELGHMLRILVRSGSEHQTIVDVGARGRERSNSYNLLKDFGWKGLLIEANPMLKDQIETEFAGLNFTLLTCAIGDTSGTMKFHIGVNDDVSSLLPDHAGSWGEIRQSIDVEVRRLSDVLEEQRIPPSFDILSLDIEGLDVRVLNDLIDSSAFRPRIVVIEASHEFHCKTMADACLSETVQAEYALVGQTFANLILQKV